MTKIYGFAYSGSNGKGHLIKVPKKPEQRIQK